jgi:hypothetical protein
MNENNLRALLHDIADRPEPAASIDIARARRSGLRRLWARRVVLPVAVTAALALAFLVPETLTSAVPGHSGVSTGASGSATSKAVPPRPKSKPTQASVPSPDGYLNPLVPYAAFGDLPPGYALDVTPSAIHDGNASTVDNLTITAAQSTGGDFIQLSVMPKDGCYGLLGGIPGWSATQDQQARCSELTGQASGRAPDVRGRIAYWGNGGTDLAWQYAPDSWAVLQAQSSGSTPFPAAQAKTLLPLMAASVKFGQTKPIVFPFRLSGAVPADWHAVSASYTVLSSGDYLASELDVAPYADYEAHGVTGLIVGAAEAADVNGNACTTPAAGGQAGSEPVVSHVQKDGLSWLVQSPAKSTGTSASQPLGVPGDDVTACNQQPDNGLYASADLKLDTTGAARTGGITAVLDHLSILGADPRSWSSTPLVG